MSLEKLLNHTCNIYHINQGESSPGFGLPSSNSFAYPDTPDISGQACHFGVKSASISITQGEPINVMDSRIKLTLPIGTDVRLNDKIVDCETGLEYTAENPINVRDHHLFVYIKKIGTERHL